MDTNRQSGQATVEYVVVGVAAMLVITVLAMVWHYASGGQLSALLSAAASHCLANGGGIKDVLLY